MYHAESLVAKQVKAMVSSEHSQFLNVEEVLDRICIEEDIQLEGRQREAVLRICQARGGAFILTGRAGSGKTFTLNIIIKTLKHLYLQNHLPFSARVMAPTGKAAQVAQNATGLAATTVHRALQLTGNNSSEPNIMIHSDCIVIDEFSMMGLQLSAALFENIPSGTKVIIMGDVEQLPSIDPGNVLQDLIASGCVPVVTLDVVKRQKEGSGILFNANQIIDGQMIHSMVVNKNGTSNNAYIFRAESDIKCRDEIIKKAALMRSRGYSIDDIQILCPQRKTIIGVDALNYALQQIWNPPNGDLEITYKTIEIQDRYGRTEKIQMKFRIGDKVIHTKNDYGMKFYRYRFREEFIEDYSRRGIINGEMGRIFQITTVKRDNKTHLRIYVKYGEDLYAVYEDHWEHLSMAYAVSIHRSQGSQWPVVLAPIQMTNRRMLNRKLLYTLYTRAQCISMLFTTEEAIQYAIENTFSSHRNTYLKEELCTS